MSASGPPLPRELVCHHPAAEGGADVHDVAVVVPTVLRPSLERALGSIYGQRFGSTTQVMVGIDGRREERPRLDRMITQRPPNVAVTVVDPGYSTSFLRGGLHGAYSGGALRTVLSYAAASARLAYLDDDNWWSEGHLADLVAALEGKDWAFSWRWFVADDGQTVLWPDEWESLGPGKGTYVERFGGFSDTNTLIVDKTRTEDVLRLWTIPIRGEEATGIGSDCNVFAALRDRPFGATGRATAYYVINRRDAMYPRRAARIRTRLVEGFDGFVAYDEGRFGDAAAAFARLVAVSPPSAIGQVWLGLCRARAGLTPLPDDGEVPQERVLEVFAGRDDLADFDSLAPRQAGCLAFFAGAHRLLAGDEMGARHWFETALDKGEPGLKELSAARAELARLSPGGPRSAP